MVRILPPNDPGRLERVLNAKKRLIGVDVDALDAGVRSKVAAEESRRQEDSAHAHLAGSLASALSAAAARAAAERAAWAREIAADRAAQQGKPTRREWDLSRPDAARLDAPARVGDDDPRCGPASMQRFDGEDLQAAERAEAQIQQAKAWWDEQARERASARAAAKAAAAAEADLAARQAAALREAAEAGQAACAAACARVAAANDRLAAMRVAACVEAAQAEAAAERREVAAVEGSPWLREDPSMAASSLSPTRVRQDHFKGLSPQQRAAIRAEQLEQLDAAREAATLGAAAEAQGAAAQRDLSAAMVRQALGAAQARQRLAKETAAALRAQIAEKAERDAAQRAAAKNKIEPCFFAQFGTSHR